MSTPAKLLPFAVALALAGRGVKLPSFYGYVYLITKPDPNVIHLMRHSPNTDYSVLERLGIGFCPAPDFAELWPGLPHLLKQETGERFALQLSGWSITGYTALYARLAGAGTLLASNAENPVQAAGNLLLQLLDKGLITADQVNHHAQLNARQ